MSGFLQGKVTEQNIAVKRFGYLLSAVFLMATVIAMAVESALLPWIFLGTMYTLSGTLWMPVLIKPFYSLFGKYLIPSSGNSISKPENNTHETSKTNR